MTIDDTAQQVFEDVGIDRAAALIGAKALGQQIIEESKTSGTPLTGLVYEVWSLYDEGEPRCQFAAPNGTKDIVFTGLFKTRSNGEPVERHCTLTQREMLAVVSSATSIR